MDSIDRENDYIEKVNELISRVNELTAITIKQNTVIRYLVSTKIRYRDKLEIPAVPTTKIHPLEAVPIPGMMEMEEDDAEFNDGEM